MTKEEFLAKARSIHGDKYEYILTKDNILKTDEVEVICPKHGSFKQKIHNLLYNKTGCLKCSKEKSIEKCSKYKIGDVFENSYGRYKIISRRPTKLVTVQFEETNTIIETTIRNAIKGSVKDFNKPIVLGIGCLGFKKRTSINIGKDKYYTMWLNMIKRCYNKKIQEKYPTYANCSVCNEWLNYSNFLKWVEENYIEDFCLDKDILVKGNKIYSPETCCFVPNEINVLFTKRNNFRGDLPIGVGYSESKKRYKASFTRGGERTFLGYYSSPEEAFQVYKKAKEDWIKELANRWKDKLKPNVYEALMNYQVEITD